MNDRLDNRDVSGSERRPTSIRYPIGILAAATLWVVLGERLILSDNTFLAQLSTSKRADVYGQFPGIAGSLLGFLVAAVAILVSLDHSRPIVEELHRGEAFTLLVVNILAGCLWLLGLCVLGVIGSGWNPQSSVFRSVFEILAYSAFVELAIGGFFFGLVVHKVGGDKRSYRHPS